MSRKFLKDCPKIYSFFALLAISCSGEVYESIVKDKAAWTEYSQTAVNKDHDSNATRIMSQIPGNVLSPNSSGRRMSFFPRGLSAQSLGIFVDDILVNDVSDPSARFDFSDIDWNEIEKVVYDPSPSESGRVGGSLFLYTRGSRLKDPEEKAGHFEIDWNSKNSSSVGTGQSFSADSAESRNQLYAHASLQEQKGMSLADAGFRPEEDKSQFFPLDFSYIRQSSHSKIKWQNRFSFLKENIDKGAGQDDINARQNTWQGQSHFLWQQKWAPQAHLKLSLQENIIRRKYNNPPDSPTDFSYGADYRGKQHFAKIENSFEMTPSLEVTPLISYKNEELRIYGDEYLPPQKDENLNLGLKSQFKTSLGSKIYLFVLSPKTYSLGLQREMLPQKLEIYFQAARAYNRASLYQKHAPFYGNKDLENEEIKSYEMGIRGEFLNSLKWALSYFENFGREQIEFSSSNSRYENVGHAQVKGAFSSITFSKDSWHLRYALTYLDTLLERRSRWQHDAQIEKEFSDFLRILVFYSQRSSQKDGLHELPTQHDLSAGTYFVLKKDWYPYMRVENILNEKHPRVWGYTRAGRELQLGLRHEF